MTDIDIDELILPSPPTPPEVETVLTAGKSVGRKLTSDENRSLGEWFLSFARSLERRFRDEGIPPRNVEDCVSETFTQAVKSIGTKQPATPPWAWLKGVARNVARDYRKKMSNRRENLTEDDELHGTPLMAQESTLDLDRFDRALKRLPPDERLLLVLLWVLDIPGPRVAEALGMNLNTLYPTVAAARKKIQEWMRLPEKV